MGLKIGNHPKQADFYIAFWVATFAVKERCVIVGLFRMVTLFVPTSLPFSVLRAKYMRTPREVRVYSARDTYVLRAEDAERVACRWK